MSNVAVPMDGGTRWLTEEQRARIALKYGPPHRWRDPNPRPGISTTFDSYVPTPADVREMDREAERRAKQERVAQVTDKLARERATRDRRRFLPRLTEAVAHGMQEALLHRADPTRYPATAAAARWLDHCPLVELAESWRTMAYDPDPWERGRHGLAMAWLVRGGVPTWAPAVRANGYLAASDLPKVLDNVANTIYLDAYAAAPRTFEAWTRAVEVVDFRSTVVTTPSFPALLPVPETAEYTRDGGFLGPTAALRLVTFGRQTAYTRQAVLADDMVMFGQLQQALGVAAAAVESDVTYDLLTSNPVMADGKALFSTAHGNLMPASDLTAASLTTASAALANQTAADGRALHLPARYLVVGTVLGTAARQLVTSMTPANTPPESGLVVVEDGRIGTGWYLMTDQWPTIATAHLADVGGPELLAMDGWNIDGRLYKARDEFGCTVMDWRSMVYTPAP